MTKGVKLEYDDNDLRAAIAQSTSWRGVMRTLGYQTSNGRTAAIIRVRAKELGFSTEHFRGKRGWTLTELASAVEASTSWAEVAARLGISAGGGDNIARVRGYAAKLGCDIRHFTTQRDPTGEMPFCAAPAVEHLRHAAASMATAWFSRRGYAVSLPTEPRPYDLVVEAGGRLHRIQVKIAGRRDSKTGGLACRISRTPLRDGKHVQYDPLDVDFFFIIDIEDNYYIVPIGELADHVYVNISTLQHRKVEH